MSITSLTFGGAPIRLAVGTNDGKVIVWPQGGLPLSLTHEGAATPKSRRQVNSIAFLDGGTRLYSAGLSKRVREWSVADGKRLRRFDEPRDGVVDVALSPGGEYLAALSLGAETSFVHCWSLERNELMFTKPGSHFVAFSPGGERVITGAFDKAVSAFDVISGCGRLVNIACTLGGARIAASSDIAASLRGHPLDMDDFEDKVDVWRPSDGAKIGVLRCFHTIASIAITRIGNKVAGIGEGYLYLWDVGVAQPRWKIRTNAMTTAELSFSIDGSRLAVTDHEHRDVISIIDGVNGAGVETLRI